MQVTTESRINFQELYSAIEKIAEAAEVPCSRDVFVPVMEVYKNQFEQGVVSFRTTTKPVGKRELDVRYVDVSAPHDPFQMALDHGFLKATGHPAESLMRELQQQCPVAGFGVDTSVIRGFTKIWTMFRETVPVADLLSLPSLPPAARNYTGLLEKYNLKRFSLAAIDFINHSFNMYVLFRDPNKNPSDLAPNLIRELGFNLPSEEEQLLFSKCADLHFTFNWDSSECERLSFVVFHAPVAKFPKHLHPMFPRMLTSYPTLLDQHYASIQSAYSKKHGDFLKIEMDYTGIIMSLRGAMDLND